MSLMHKFVLYRRTFRLYSLLVDHYCSSGLNLAVLVLLNFVRGLEAVTKTTT